MRFDCHKVAAPPLVEVERGHQADHRSRTGLMTSDLEAVGVVTNVVGVVDDLRAEPQHPILNAPERLEITLGGPG